MVDLLVTIVTVVLVLVVALIGAAQVLFLILEHRRLMEMATGVEELVGVITLVVTPGVVALSLSTATHNLGE